MYPREAKDVPTSDNPVSTVRHRSMYGTEECEGIVVYLWCPGCQSAHTPVFRCHEHGGPSKGPVWQGDPYGLPLTITGSYLVYESDSNPRCHSNIEEGQWNFLEDCTHSLRGHVPLEPLPDWLVAK